MNNNDRRNITLKKFIKSLGGKQLCKEKLITISKSMPIISPNKTSL